jgi:hypothetical protein
MRRRGEVVVSLAVGAAVWVAVQLLTGWAIHTDRVPLRDPLYLDKLEALRALPAFNPDAPAEPKPLTVVFVGSSRTLVAVDAGAVGPALSTHLGRRAEAFNFGTAGAGPVTCAVYLRRLLADGVKPDAVVIEVLPALLAAQVDAPEARWFPVIRLRPEEIPIVRGYGFPAQPPAAHGCRGWLLSWHEYRMPLVGRYAGALSLTPFPMAARKNHGAHGFERWHLTGKPIDRAKLLERTKREYAAYLDGYAPGGCGIAAVRDTLEACRAANVRAALLLAPESSEFRDWYPEPGKARIVPLLTELARETGAGLIDAREWVADELLVDGHHLTGEGVDAFTARLACEGLAPWLSAPGSGGAP